MVTEWEYIILKASLSKGQESGPYSYDLKELDRHGRDGWEAVCLLNDGLLLKRQR